MSIGVDMITVNEIYDVRHHSAPEKLIRKDHAKKAFPVKGSNHFAIPSSFLKKALQGTRINASSTQKKNLTREAFISKSRNNIVLIEAR